MPSSKNDRIGDWCRDGATQQAIAAVEFDAENPYDNTDVSSLPVWWQVNIREFEASDLRTYLPSTFADGIIVQLVRERLEDTCGISIQLVGVGVGYGDDWDLRVDGETVASLERRRDSGGYTVFEISSEEFERLVASAIKDGCV